MLRIIGGRAKGTRLASPRGQDTRPTLGYVRESIFNVLHNVGLEGATVLDIFSGTGAMALEAVSRGARNAICLERRTGQVIRDNARRCGMDGQIYVIGGDAINSLRMLQGKRFDYIFMDPPYGKGYVASVLDLIFGCSLYADNAIITVEHSEAEKPNIHDFSEVCTIWKEKRTGGTFVTYLRCQ